MACWSLSILSLTLKFKFMDTCDILVSKVPCIRLPSILYLQDLLILPGQKQWIPECATIFAEDSNTNSYLWVDIISLPDKFQRILVIRPLRTYKDPIFQARMQRNLIKMEIHKRNNIVLPVFNGKQLLGQQSRHRNEYFTILYVYGPHQFILRTAGETNTNPAIASEMAGI